MARAFTVNGRSFHWSFDRGRADAAVLHGALDPLVGQALVGRVQIDNDDPVRRLGDAVGLVNLRPSDAQRGCPFPPRPV